MQTDKVPKSTAPAEGTAPKTPEKTAKFAPLPDEAEPDTPSVTAPQTPADFRKAMAAQSPTKLGLLRTPARRFMRTMRVEMETVPAAATPSMFNTPPRRPGRTPATRQFFDADTADSLPPATPTPAKRGSSLRPDYVPRSSDVVAEARRLQEAEKATARARMGMGNNDDRSSRGGNRGV
ncbi:hypothetical protein K4K53_000269 [Colletotrichum sp. SAR 10_77]|nr:hypothetical protein K4K51_000884 [Colletotrichum sp. SAR 10_75]KAI8249183.1 hypothetical protein K4K53_000269 [Colletotrichum sp. SAR 10_77]